MTDMAGTWRAGVAHADSCHGEPPMAGGAKTLAAGFPRAACTCRGYRTNLDGGWSKGWAAAWQECSWSAEPEKGRLAARWPEQLAARLAAYAVLYWVTLTYHQYHLRSVLLSQACPPPSRPLPCSVLLWHRSDNLSFCLVLGDPVGGAANGGVWWGAGLGTQGAGGPSGWGRYGRDGPPGGWGTGGPGEWGRQGTSGLG